MEPIAIMAIIASIGLVLTLVILLVLLGRAWTITERIDREASRWRQEAWRKGVEVLQLRRQMETSPTRILSPVPAVTPTATAGPNIRTSVTRASAPVPPIAAQTAADTGEHPTVPGRRPRNSRSVDGDRS